MGSTFKSAIFEEHIKEGLIHWAQKAKKKGKKKKNPSVSKQRAKEVQLQSTSVQEDSLVEEDGAEIVEGNDPRLIMQHSV